MHAFFRTFYGRIALLLALALAPFLVFEFYSLAQLRSRLIESSAEQAQTLARAVALQHRSLLKAALLALEQIALMDPVRSGDSGDCAVRLLEVRNTTPLFINIARGLPDGSVDCAGRAGQTRFIPQAMVAVQEVVRTGQPAVAPATISPNHGRPIIPLARPLIDVQGGRQRILVAGASLEWLDRLVADLAIGAEAMVLVLDDRNTILASYPAKPELIGKPLPGADSAGAGALLSVVFADQVHRHLSITGFEGGIRVAVGIDTDHALAEAEQRLRAHFIVLVPVVLLSILIFAGFAHILLVRRYRQFEAAALKIGAGDLATRLESDPADSQDYRRFAQAFNAMAASIADRDARLARQKRVLDEAQRIAHMGSWEWDLRGDRQIWSDGVWDIMGVPPGSIAPTRDNWRRCVHPDDLDRVTRTINESMNQGGYRLEYRIIRPDGRVRNVEVIGVRSRDAADGVERVFGLVADITERKRAVEEIVAAKDQAELANRAKTQLLTNMSHELRTPLNAIIGYAEALLTGLHGALANANQREYLQDIFSSGRHLLELINDILDVAAAEAGQIALNLEAVDPEAIVEAALRLVRSRAEKGGVDLRLDKPDTPLRLRADPLRLKQILINLLSNAVKFTPEGGRVTLSLEGGPGQGCRLRVVDTGIGMDEAGIVTALQPFGQVDSRLARRYEGTGLGLPLAKSLVELHGGTLSIDSAKGRGTTVTVFFPPEALLGAN
ncbi:MAG: PAS domain-containing protein [Rhodospirillales bacterium]|nr:PAS domain-containing protein [Rhodospirillales bacterium]